MKFALLLIAGLLTASAAWGAQVPGEVTDIKAVCRNGQTFITWKDAAEGEAGAKFRYSIYRSDNPITQANLAGAECLQKEIFYNSVRLLGYAFSDKSRQNPAGPMVALEDLAAPRPMWSGVAAVTVKKDGKSYYAVLLTGLKGEAAGNVVPGKSATTEPVVEKVAPTQPIKLGGAKGGAIGSAKKPPLYVELHGSNGGPGDRGYGAEGDDYLYFAAPEMGYRDGLQGVFQVREIRGKQWSASLASLDPCLAGGLMLSAMDTIEHPRGVNALSYTQETFWFGYLCVPQWADHKEPRAYPFTERRMLWLVDWTIKKYDVDPDRVYAGGGSMGAWGSTTFAFRHPELFAAVYPNRPRTRQRGLPGLVNLPQGQKEAMMDDGKTPYFERMDMVKFAADHREDLPFYGWCCGRNDGFATWKEEIDMVKAMAAAHHGFAFAWNDGDHKGGTTPMETIAKYYGPDKFAKNRSYPAFGNSSIDNDLGSGELDGNKQVKDGEKEGGINLGFSWKDVVDEEGRWSAKIANSLSKAEMTVDVTPRRCQRFKAKPGEKFKWSASAGGGGTVAADQWGLVTAEKVKILPGVETIVIITK